MNKQERRDLITSLFENEENTEAEIIAHVVNVSGVKEATVKKDIDDLLREDDVLTFEPTGNEEMDKGRVTEYAVPEDEDTLVHAEIEKVSFNRTGSEAGVKTSKPSVVKFDVRAWNNFKKNAHNLGYSYVRVLYAPEGVDIEVLKPKVIK